MRTRLYIQKKSSSKSKSTPVTNQFQSRPFAPPTEVSPQQQPDLQTQQEKPKTFGHSLANFSITNRHAAGQLPIQTKLTIGQPGDKYEQEADRVASQVVNQINSPVAQKSQAKKIQREELPEEDELMMKPEAGIIQREDVPEDDEEIQMKPLAAQRGTATPDLEASIQQARSSGQPLNNEIRGKMESAFGSNFSRVKIHNDAQSDQLNRSIQARAFTTGKDIFFRQGAYDPGSRSGQELLAHELTHVVQQSGGKANNQLQRTIEGLSISAASTSVIQRDELRDYLVKKAKIPFLQEYAAKNWLSESIDFWHAVRRYKKDYKPNDGPSLTIAQNLRDIYITGNGEVNIDGTIRDQCLNSFNGTTPNNHQLLNVFDAAQQSIYNMLVNDAWPKFKKSEEYQQANNQNPLQYLANVAKGKQSKKRAFVTATTNPGAYQPAITQH